ncbi:MAG: hypothetical protein R2751_11725 [Bacteroidales bacterium]
MPFLRRGMGNVARQGQTSLRPRYQEGARYYLQYAGFPDSLIWKREGPDKDYTDDYKSRGVGELPDGGAVGSRRI